MALARVRDLGRSVLLELARGMAELLLGRLNGAGGFAKLVAIKRILPQLAQDKQFTQMFLDEGRIAALAPECLPGVRARRGRWSAVPGDGELGPTPLDISLPVGTHASGGLRGWARADVDDRDSGRQDEAREAHLLVGRRPIRLDYDRGDGPAPMVRSG